MKNVNTRDFHFKDQSLDRLAAYGNVAQFASFGPDLKMRYSRIVGCLPNQSLGDVTKTVQTLLRAAPEGRVNVRSFRPDSPQGNEFLYALEDVDAVVGQVLRLAGMGLHTIVNETIDVGDGGVSGVYQGGIIEFAPGNTPRVVESGRPASLPGKEGLRILEIVYGFIPDLDFTPNYRVEFSIHPLRRGWRKTHTILWELEELVENEILPNVNWPNDFSEFIGDKIFGLLVAHTSGWHVPRTVVLSRVLSPFSFGQQTSSDVKWIRTCPKIPIPGRFSTFRGWVDPFKVLAVEDPQGVEIASVAIQDEVPPQFSGALLSNVEGDPIVEGVAGYGDELMLGKVNPAALPSNVETRVRELYAHLWRDLGSVRLEWVDDGDTVWVLQLQQEQAKSFGTVIVPGEVRQEIEFKANDGLENLRTIIKAVKPDTGILLIGNVGMTSHMADLLRRAGIPSRLLREPFRQNALRQ